MQQEFLEALIVDALDMVTVLDNDGSIRYGSSSTEWVLGYEPEELIGKSLFDFIHQDDVPNTINAFNDGLQIPGCIVFLEFRFQHKDGSWCDLEVVAKNFFDNPVVAGIVFSSRDATERVWARRESMEVGATMIRVSEDVLKNTTKCAHGFSCLHGEGERPYPVEHAVGDNLLFVKCTDSSCSYQTPFGYSYILCTCPTRKELHRQYTL